MSGISLQQFLTGLSSNTAIEVHLQCSCKTLIAVMSMSVFPLALINYCMDLYKQHFTFITLKTSNAWANLTNEDFLKINFWSCQDTTLYINPIGCCHVKFIIYI